MASTTYQQLLIVSELPIPYYVAIMYKETPANQQIAQASLTSGKIGPFGIKLVVPASCQEMLQ